MSLDMSALGASRLRVDRERLIVTAAALVNRHGLDSLSMSDLAAALGVRTPSLYSHVAGIDDVKRLLALHGLADLDGRIARTALGQSAGDAVRAVIRGYR